MPEEYVPYPHQPSREIDFGVISEGFNLVWKNIGPFAVTALVAVVAYCAVYFAGVLITLPMMGTADPTSADVSALMARQMTSTLIQIPFTLLAYGILGPFALSMSMMTLKLVRGEPVQVGDLGLGFSRFGSAFLATLAITFCVTIGSYLCCLPGLIFGGLFMFTLPLIADRGLQPFEAMGQSWTMLKSHMWMALLFYLVISLLSGLGVIACGIGILVTVPLMYVCMTLVYRDFTIGRPIPGYTPPPAAPEGM
ncbi:MAG: hypothetical protein JST30_00625 [Armatimonadetes bacterium]|nr:hypothetical protein [Armatimonadota bacterium]